MANSTHAHIPKYVQRRVQNSLTYLFLFLLLLTVTAGLYRGGVHLVHLRPEETSIGELPAALFLSLLRMTVSFFASLAVAYALGLAAARSETGERLIIPLLDILQSVPVVAFFPAAVSLFFGIAGVGRLGIECAAIFLIFASQAWSLAFAVYEAMKTIPQDNTDAMTSFGVRGSQRFWKLYLPASIPRLVYSSILAWTNGWFFLVACEIIAVGRVQYNLPGIGNFLARAAEQDRMDLVIWGLVALALLILLLDFLIWRPASLWAERFRQEQGPAAEGVVGGRLRLSQKIFEQILPFASSGERRPSGYIRTMTLKMIRSLFYPVIWLVREILLPLVWDLPAALARMLWIRIEILRGRAGLERWSEWMRKARWARAAILTFTGATLGAWAALHLFGWLRPPWPSFVREIPLAILYSTARLVAALTLSLLWVLPVVLWCWDKPRARQALTTVAQVGASLPAIALFPLIILVLVHRFGGGAEAASIILLLTGMQWYILFNALGGAAIIPGDLAEATRALGLSRYQRWKHLLLPAIRPALVTGSITAWGAGWNALVVSEYVTYKGQTQTVKGLGALLNRSVYQSGDNRAIMICITAMVAWIILINAVIWRPLYRNAADRYKFEA